MNNLCDELLNIKKEDFGSIDHRKNLATFFALNQQEVLDLPKREFKTLVIGLIKGRIYGKLEASDEIKSEFFCVPIDIWNHKEEEFKTILKECMDEMKESTDDKEE